MNDFSTRQLGECRRTKPTWRILSLARRPRPRNCCASAYVWHIGFSTSTCLPASIAAMASSAWVLFQVQMLTASTSASANSSGGSL